MCSLFLFTLSESISTNECFFHVYRWQCSKKLFPAAGQEILCEEFPLLHSAKEIQSSVVRVGGDFPMRSFCSSHEMWQQYPCLWADNVWGITRVLPQPIQTKYHIFNRREQYCWENIIICLCQVISMDYKTTSVTIMSWIFGFE